MSGRFFTLSMAVASLCLIAIVAMQVCECLVFSVF
jgi:hypothetical protein